MFLYTNNELSENELRKQSHLQVHQKNKSNKGSKITVLGKLQDINEKNQRQHKWKEVLCSWIERSIFKMTTLPKAIYSFKAK